MATKTRSKAKTTRKKTAGKGKSKAASKTKKLTLQPRDTASEAQLALHATPQKQLEEILKRGQKPRPELLDGWRFRGLNVGFGAKLIGVQKFIKIFKTIDYGFGQMMTGHNIVVKQNDIKAPYEKKLKNGEHKIQGVYLVEENNQRFNAYDSSALLNYGRGDNPWYEPAKMLRDYLTQPYPDNNDLFLGKAYFAFGPLKIFGGYFILERLEEIE